MQFKSIPGHGALKAQLVQSVKDNRVSHAQLFLGPAGSGALPLAVAYAQYVNCLDKGDDDSCGVCAACRKYEKYVHPDLHFSYPFYAESKEDTAADFMDKWRAMLLDNMFFDEETWRGMNTATKQPNINIAECHAIIKKLSLKAFEAKTKVLVMWLPEYLGKEGNTLLKLIEEPPADTLFILVAENTEHILSTILSRTQILKAGAYSQQEVREYLAARGTEKQAADDVAFLAEGNMVLAERLAQSTDNDYTGQLQQWLQLTYQNKGLQYMALAEKLAEWNREEQKSFLQYGINFMRECVLLLNGAHELVRLNAQARTIAENLSARVLNMPMAEAIAEVLGKAHYHAERNANAKILFLDVSLQLVQILHYRMIPEGTYNIYT